MGRTLEARIMRAAKKVLRRERELEVANEKYDALIEEAHRRGIEAPRTLLTNPFMPPRRKAL